MIGMVDFSNRSSSGHADERRSSVVGFGFRKNSSSALTMPRRPFRKTVRECKLSMTIYGRVGNPDPFPPLWRPTLGPPRHRGLGADALKVLRAQINLRGVDSSLNEQPLSG